MVGIMIVLTLALIGAMILVGVLLIAASMYDDRDSWKDDYYD
jgi:hypothetical protein